MRSVSAVAVMSGPVVLSGYVAGSVVATWTSANRRVRRPGKIPPKTSASDLILEAFLTLTVSTAAWWVIQELSPGSGFSRIGYLSDQVLSVWQSVALWSGLAVIVGLVAPVFHRFDGSRGLAAATAMMVAHYPWFLLSSMAVGGTAMLFGRPNRDIQIVSIVAVLPVAWLAWIFTWQSPWGLTAGPETTVWVMVLTLVLVVRWWSDRFVPTEDEPF